MKKSWREFFRRVAATCLLGAAGSSAWTAAVCHAITASDNASDPVYADGWQEGDNGGTGFTGWNFDGTYASTVQQRIDNGGQSGALGSSTFNDVGRAWSLFNPVVEGGGGQRDVARAGRGFAPLEVGQTLKVVIDNPGELLFFRGYTVRLSGNTGGMNGNICYNGTACSPGAAPKEKMHFATFEYFTSGEWNVGNEHSVVQTGLFSADSTSPPRVGTNSGVRLEVKLTGA